MKNRALPLYLISLSTLFAIRGVGEEESAGIRPLLMEVPPVESLNRFGLSYRMGFNIETKFKNFGSFSKPFPRVNLDHDPYNYDNGYVYPDAGTPNSGLTHYWGYQGFTYGGSSQLPGNETILMQRASSTGINSGDRDEGALPGVELTYNRELGRNQSFRWGLEAAFNYLNLSVKDDQTLQGGARLLTDAYPLLVPEYLLPPAGYQGRASGPAVVIGASPQSRSETSIPETVGGSRQFDADIFGFRLGPYLEIPLSKTFSVALSGGLSLAEINSDFRFTETIQVGALTLPSTRGSGSHSDWLAGGYVEGTVSCAVTKSAALVAGVQFQDLGRYSQVVSGKEAALNLNESLFVTLGLTYSF
jgi:hypothetical protein